jgi:hypothetical protein
VVVVEGRRAESREWREKRERTRGGRCR